MGYSDNSPFDADILEVPNFQTGTPPAVPIPLMITTTSMPQADSPRMLPFLNTITNF